jgi:DNA-binding transcriptional LysR family regulator
MLSRVELTTLRYFRAIARHGHLTRAARELGVTQPALSAMLRKLEKELGTELLHRTGRGVELTEAGGEFLTHAELAIREADAGVRAVRELLGLERGTVRVGGGATAITYLLPPVIAMVRARHPGLRFSIREAGSTQVALAVSAGELDLGIVTLPVSLESSDSILSLPLVEDELRLITPRGHGLARGGGGFRWKDLAGVGVVGFEAGSAVREVIDSAASRAGVVLNYVMELRSIESIKGMVSTGIGVGFVSRFALGGGEGLACRDGKLARQLAIVRRRDRVPGAGASAFEKALLARVKKA